MMYLFAVVVVLVGYRFGLQRGRREHAAAMDLAFGGYQAPDWEAVRKRMPPGDGRWEQSCDYAIRAIRQELADAGERQEPPK